MKDEKEIRLRAFFQGKGLTFKRAAEILGVHPSAVGNLVAGRNLFGAKVAKDWADKFGLSAEWLMYGTGEMLQEPASPGGVSISRSDGNNTVVGNNNSVTAAKGLDGALEVIKSQQETIREQQRNIDRILTLLEKSYE